MYVFFAIMFIGLAPVLYALGKDFVTMIEDSINYYLDNK